ncbi:MAG TPA: glutamine--tRNA ligase/YqeY domain fusion protein [Candidatus Rifleibacterium sp.]|nr:glutamine--tRNA ligase/YqeY domain fusion protein [Candidatus Rifleibacterium sp.]HPT45927.1 glutamine--tRNA ligase/YqeY domain fusion protein [Candidatus Rifleibacterium sp.]
MSVEETSRNSNFIRDIIDEDLKSGKHKEIVTRFPPEPNGYLHVGHAKSICLNFGLARDYQGRCHLRFDDTNPVKEEQEYIDSIKEDVRWLGFDWGKHEYYASDYFQQLYDWAILLIKEGKAYVDDQTADEIRVSRGTLTEPGKNSPHRNRTVEENLDLFTRMKDGEFKNGERVLRAKIDMAAPNINMRDPVLYRILHAHHPRTGDKWCIYPMYDYTHGQSDALEHISHSICTLEFQDHRPLYDWFIANLPVPARPHQYEFARLNLTYTVMSKRKLLRLVQEKKVLGWDDPRMPTISGMRRRGYPAASLREFCDRIGVAKANSTVEFGLLENCVRDDLNRNALRFMAVLRPLKVVITNYPEGKSEYFDAENNPEDPNSGTRKVKFTREIFIEQEDFMETPPKKFFRLSPGSEVRLKHSYYITCKEVIKDAQGKVVELRCELDPESRGGSTPDGRRVKGTLHWVSASEGLKAEVRQYDHLFKQENPDKVEEGADFLDNINPDSLEILSDCVVEPAVADVKPGIAMQFLRMGYFCKDKDSAPGKMVFNRTISLKDGWAKEQKKQND